MFKCEIKWIKISCSSPTYITSIIMGLAIKPYEKIDFWSFLWVSFLLNDWIWSYCIQNFTAKCITVWGRELYFKQRNALDLKYGKKLSNPSFRHSSKHILQQLSSPANILFHMSSVLFCSSGGLPQQCFSQTQHPATVCSSNFLHCLTLMVLEIMFCLNALRRIFLLLLTVGSNRQSA